MDMDVVVGIMQQSLTMVLLLSAPMLIIGLGVGLIVSVFQATTQIQEATLAFVPKIVAVMLSMVVFGPWMMSSMVSFTQNIFSNIDKYIK